MKKIDYILMLLILICFLSGCTTEPKVSFTLNETPQVYVLQDEDVFALMPTVTLFENGNAQLSQPPISSFALLEFGHYEVNENTLTVTYGENSTMTFTVSNDGDALMVTSSDLSFTKIGTVYNYRPNADYRNQYPQIAGEALTIDALRILTAKAPNLTFSDLEHYAHFDTSADRHIFDVDGMYTLTVIDSDVDDTSCTLQRNSDGERFPLNLNGSTNLVFDVYLGLASPIKYTPEMWFDRFSAAEQLQQGIQALTLPAFPNTTFRFIDEKVTANNKILFSGMPIWNVYLADLTNDGKPELCATIGLGSGIVDSRIIVYDYTAGNTYQLADRMHYDYYLSLDDEKLIVTQTNFMEDQPLASAELQLVNGEIFRFGQSEKESP
jgi:hypothetical protein